MKGLANHKEVTKPQNCINNYESRSGYRRLKNLRILITTAQIELSAKNKLYLKYACSREKPKSGFTYWEYGPETQVNRIIKKLSDKTKRRYDVRAHFS